MDKSCQTCVNYTDTCKKCVNSGTFSGWKSKEWSCETCGYVDTNDVNGGCWSPRDCVKGSEWSPKASDVCLNSEPTSEPQILDSGERREFETGAVRDIQEGKGRCDLMPLDMVERFMCGPGSKSRVLHFIERFRLSGDVNNVACAMEQFCMVRGWSKAEAMMELSKHFAAGAEKYGVDNWRKGLPEWSYMSSAVRHYIKWVDGWTDEPHDRAVLWNLICLWWTHENITEVDDERVDV